MKRVFLMLPLLLFFQLTRAGFIDTAYIYDPFANAAEDIAKAVSEAKNQHKFVLIQAGGNWCSWCLRFNKFVTDDQQIDSFINANFIVYHLNYSPENRNEAVFAKYGFPQRFGFPVFIILDNNGNLIHTQNSAYLEQGKGYNKEEVFEFLKAWSPAALDPANYRD